MKEVFFSDRAEDEEGGSANEATLICGQFILIQLRQDSNGNVKLTPGRSG